jgi:hypothetical protein
MRKVMVNPMFTCSAFRPVSFVSLVRDRVLSDFRSEVEAPVFVAMLVDSDDADLLLSSLPAEVDDDSRLSDCAEVAVDDPVRLSFRVPFSVRFPVEADVVPVFEFVTVRVSGITRKWQP